MRTSKLKALVLLSVLFSQPLSAQTPVIAQAGNFFVCIIAGILLAFAFQFLFTNLAVAAGISSVGDLSKTSSNSSSSSSMSGPKAMSGLGIFMTFTMAVSLFFASLIAVKISLLPSNIVGFSLGLIIWAGYLLIGLYVDSKMISSLTGSAFSAVKDALRSGASAVTNLFESSEQQQAEATARETVSAIHKEIRKEYDISDLGHKLDAYVEELKPDRVDMDDLHERIAELLHDLEVREAYTPDDPAATKRLFLEVAGKQPNLSEKDKKKLSSTFDEVSRTLKESGSPTDKAMALVDRVSPGSESSSKRYRQQIKSYLEESEQEELQPQQLRNDLEYILQHPKAAPSVVKERAQSIDRSTIAAIISAADGKSKHEIERYVDRVEDALRKVSSRASSKTSDAAERVKQTTSSGSTPSGQRDAETERTMEQWFNRMNQPELRYERLKWDAQQIMDDPKATPSVVGNRLKAMDRESFIALMSNNRHLSREQVERAALKLEEARDKVVQRAEEMEEKAKTKWQETKERTLQQAEQARRTAAAAAWWVFVAAIVSGAASAVGGILALTI